MKISRELLVWWLAPILVSIAFAASIVYCTDPPLPREPAAGR